VVVVVVMVVTDSEAWAKAVPAGVGDWDSAVVVCAVSFALGSEPFCPPFLGRWPSWTGTGSLARKLLLAAHPIICSAAVRADGYTLVPNEGVLLHCLAVRRKLSSTAELPGLRLNPLRI